jgi:hypothetical protein
VLILNNKLHRGLKTKKAENVNGIEFERSLRSM